ncbi:Rv2175c family DNA-binding protein [Amycolatopsis alkalitolerans]|uniref:Helix-turn-helix domain-containing protein n=1 Tax=Amycolatopsis alkalitolerans TaxID=2547244 RepID=A0A5C4M0G4_9PSEU|nr:Rv2175c family DNA-binding protein [Amycolatopsis alkalitolerans]TNC23952.1 helix-turn-helix domain-containing protein [Amycolatopsis alkalitolerans]
MSAIPVADDVLGPDVAVLSLETVSERLGHSANKVRQLLRDGQLLAVRRDGALYVPADFLAGSAPVKGLAGLLTVLHDAGFSRTEMLRWLYTEDESLPGVTPINALRTNHGTEVKRRAQAMAF